MLKLSISVSNDTATSKTNLVLPILTDEAQGKDMAQAIGFALKAAYELLKNKKHDRPVVTIGGFEFSVTESMKFKKDFDTFRLEFPLLRAKALAGMVNVDDAKERLEYVKSVDVNGVYKNSKSVSLEAAVASMIEHKKVIRDIVKWTKTDAKDSTIPASVKERRERESEVRRIEAAKAKLQIEDK